MEEHLKCVCDSYSVWIDIRGYCIAIYTDKASVTCQDATSNPWDTLYLCDVVVGEVFITSCVEGLRITERPPQFCGDGFIVYFNDFSTDVVSFRDESSIPKEADPTKKVNKSIIGTFVTPLETLTNKKKSHLREDRRVDGSLDDSSINSQDGEDDTGQEDQCQLVDIFDAHKHHHCHEAQDNGTIHPHVVEESRLSLRPLQALNLENGCLRNDINLKVWKDGREVHEGEA